MEKNQSQPHRQPEYIELHTRCTLCHKITGKKTLLGNQLKPADGDYSLCVHCNMLGEFVNNMQELRMVSKGEYDAMKLQDSELHKRIAEMCNINEAFRLSEKGISIYISQLNILLPFKSILERLP